MKVIPNLKKRSLNNRSGYWLFDMNFGQSSTLDAILVHRHGERHHGMLKLFPDSKDRANERIIHLLRTTPVTSYARRTRHELKTTTSFEISFLRSNPFSVVTLQLFHSCNTFGDTSLGNGMSYGQLPLTVGNTALLHSGQECCPLDLLSEESTKFFLRESKTLFFWLFCIS